MVINNAVYKRMERVEECLRRLERKRRLTMEEFLEDTDAQDVVLHNLQVAIEACLDIGSHIISKNGWQMPEVYSDTPKTLAKHNVISEEFKPVFIKMGKFRDVVVHEYLDINLEKVYHNLHKIDDIRRYLKFIKEFLEKEEG
jgi:uncharacterized protein YutE (UPF0331/DUF86 family)